MKPTKQHIVLREIHLRGRRVSAEELIRATGFKPPAVYDAIRHLRNRGLVVTELETFGGGFRSPPSKKLYVEIKKSAIKRVIWLTR